MAIDMVNPRCCKIQHCEECGDMEREEEEKENREDLKERNEECT